MRCVFRRHGLFSRPDSVSVCFCFCFVVMVVYTLSRSVVHARLSVCLGVFCFVSVSAMVGVCLQVISACLLDLKEGGAGSSSSDGKLYSLKIRLEPTATPYNGTNNFSGKGKGQELRPPFWGGEMVGLRSARWRWSEEAPLGVVQLWDPVYDTQSKKSFVKDALIIRVLVCASSAGGDGVGGRGGWLPLSNIQECLGKAKPGEGVSVSLVGLGSLTTSSREFQAIMAVSDFPESARRCLLDPAFTKERPLPNTSPWRKLAVGRGVVVERDVSVATDGAGGTDNVVGVFGSEGGPVGAGAGAGAGCGDAAAGKEGGPPPNVSDKLWTTVVSSFNPSQVKAIRKVADGSPSGFTLLQVGRLWDRGREGP